MVKSSGGVASHLISGRKAFLSNCLALTANRLRNAHCLLYVDLSEGNKFSAGEQWAELYNDEELRLALEEAMSPK